VQHHKYGKFQYLSLRKGKSLKTDSARAPFEEYLAVTFMGSREQYMFSSRETLLAVAGPQNTLFDFPESPSQ
jgi:hypothetical protein